MENDKQTEKGEKKDGKREKIAAAENTSSSIDGGNVEKDCSQRLEASASRLIQAVSSYEAERGVCFSIIPSNPRQHELDGMISKILTNLLQTIHATSKNIHHEKGGRTDDNEATQLNVQTWEVEDATPIHLIGNSSTLNIKDLPSFSLGCGLTQATPKKRKESEVHLAEVSGVSKHVQFSENKSDGKEDAREEQCTVKNTAFNGASRNTVKSAEIIGDKKMDREMENNKREIKPSEFLKSPYVKRLLNLRKKQHLDERKIWNWVFKSQEPKDAVIFKWKYVSNTREDLMCLEEDKYIFYYVVDTWILILNHNEIYRSDKSPYRFFFPIISTDIEGVNNENYETFERRMITIWRMFPKVKLQDLDMVFFTLIESDTHFYIICYNLESPTWELIDNRAICPDTEETIPEYPFTMHKNFVTYLRSVGHPKVDEIQKLELVRMEMKWQTKTETFNCGVFVMRHLESYMGEGSKGWTCQLSAQGDNQTKQLNRLRSLYLHEVLTSEINERSFDNVSKCELFHKLQNGKRNEERLQGKGVEQKRTGRLLRTRKE